MCSICRIETNLEVPIMISNNQALHLCKSCIEEYIIDTSQILFICGGAFESLTMDNTSKKSPLGFSAVNEVNANISEKSRKIDAKSLTKQGMIPEFIDRFPIIIQLNDLTKQDLKRILVEPENSIIQQYKNLIE